MFDYHYKLIEHMVKATPKTIVALILLSCMYLYAFVNIIPRDVLIVWSVLQGIFIYIRYINSKKLQKYLEVKDNINIRKHIKYFFYSLLYSTFVWNFAFMSIVFYAPQHYELIAFAVMMGILTASISSISALYKIFVIYFIFMLTPLLIVMFIFGEHSHKTVLLFMPVFIPTILILARFVKHNILELSQVNDMLAKELLKEHKISITDGLTGLYNRRYLFDTLEDILKLSQREGYKSTFLMIDIDHFKNVNDTYGHQAGDFILSEVAKHIKSAIRKSDIVARVGGEEFALFLYNTNYENGMKIAQTLCDTIARKKFLYHNIQIDVKVSIGVATMDDKINNVDLLYKKADENLYRAKENGRNQVV